MQKPGEGGAEVSCPALFGFSEICAYLCTLTLEHVFMRLQLCLGLLLSCVTSASAFTIIDGTLEHSEIYPGTTHRVKVSVPENYQGDGSECLYLGMDGILCNAPAVLDSLAEAGEIPRMVGVFLEAGLIRDSENPELVLRYNRSNEFDAVDSRFGRFLKEELLPYIQELKTEDGKEIVWAPGGDNAMIFGLSSGGAAAMAAAWHHPELVRRVFTGCGTYVPMRGADQWATTVRRSEPLPLRFFLQDGYTDTWNPLFGSWYEANRMLQSALDFSGYDAEYDWAEGGHSVRRASEIFPEVIKWLWRDYPAPITAGVTENNLLKPLLENSSDWEGTDYKPLAASPEATFPDGRHRAGNPHGLWIDQWQIAADGTESAHQKFYRLHSIEGEELEVSSMAFDGNGNLWVLTGEGIQILDQNGRVRGILRLPSGFEVPGSAIVIAEGFVTISSPESGVTYIRRLNVPAASPGTRPASQGQG